MGCGWTAFGAGMAVLWVMAGGLAPAVGAAPDSPLEDCQPLTDGVRLDLEITGIRLPAGNVTVVLYSGQAEDFLVKGKRLNRIRIPVHENVARACMTAPAPGAYAIAFYHDRNDNRKLDRTMLGLPAEGFGFSNDAPAMLGLPRFKDVVFTAKPGDNPLKMTVRY